MNFRPTSTLGSIIARAAFVAERDDVANNLIDRLFMLVVSDPKSHASRVLRLLIDGDELAQLRSQIESELSSVEPVDRTLGARIRSDFFAKIFDRVASAAIVGERGNTGHILLLAATDPTAISGEILRRHRIDHRRLSEAMGVLAVDEDRYLDLRLR